MRFEHKKEVIMSLEKAQKIVFSPLTFQAIGAMLDFGILKSIDVSAKTKEELMLAIEKYIDYYTNKRVQRNLGVLTPLEFHEQKLESVA